MTPEFSRPVRIDTIGSAPRTLSIAADEAERAALAQRFDLASLEAIGAEIELRAAGEAIEARGTATAMLAQRCVVTGEDVPAGIAEPFAIVFRPPPGADGGDEVELGADDLDVMFIEGSSIDLGEAVAETVALALDPYPRAPGAEAALQAAGVKSEEEMSPFAALAALKDGNKC